MGVVIYLAPGSPLIAALTDDPNRKYLNVNIKRTSKNKILLLPEHPTLPDSTVIAITKYMYCDMDEPPPAHIALHDIMTYYDYYDISPTTEEALFRHLDSDDPQITIILTSNTHV